ncbi:glycerophosphodiester phosphodiesterase [Anaerolinea sp.]|uniref:glycerophosphodiester phosphodiesterase n=1 Tax=Anaerolinea sp. TaxID=1872519 RepID=UPI002ACDCFA4|nr:glycerophosphodiester phosphodiesterase family protein [Anaerolinea sp.]
MNEFRLRHETLIIAHRGASAYAPENTLAAFRLAIEQGADAIELDAKLSADGHVVVIHDPTVDRTTNGKGWVHRLTLAELKNLDAGRFFSAKFSGEPIPTLEEVFVEIAPSLLVNVELTNYASPTDALVEKVCHLVKKYHLEDRVLFSSFHPLNLIRARQILPEVPVALLALEGRGGWWARSFVMRGLSPEFLHPYYTDATASFIQKQHQKGRRINVWTVNQVNAMQELVQNGVDGLITDDPLLAREVLGR